MYDKAGGGVEQGYARVKAQVGTGRGRPCGEEYERTPFPSPKPFSLSLRADTGSASLGKGRALTLIVPARPARWILDAADSMVVSVWPLKINDDDIQKN